MKISGFTLLETIVYCALFGVLMTSALVTVYSLMDSNDRAKQSISLIAEAAFINQKLVWVFTGAANVTAIDAQTVHIARPDLGTDNPLVLEAFSNNWYLTRGSAQPQALTGLPFAITEVVVNHNASELTIDYKLNGESFQFYTHIQ